jgi:hypothetical protein
MMVFEVIEKSREADHSSSELQRIVARQVEELIVSSDLGSNPDHPRKHQWSYRIPYPGVRYYSYEEL